MAPEGGAPSQVQVQGWAVGGERAQGPEEGHGHGMEDAAGPTTLMHEQEGCSRRDTCVFPKLTVSQEQLS